MKTLYEVVKRPLITEKSTLQKDQHNQLTFEVDRKANKLEIKKAVEDLFKVKVINVRVINMEGKQKRMGRFLGKKRDWKKAVVRLRTGDRIEFFEGA
ncbi:MAG: 50S ribosomal protein L23 [Deltaproteobacteria bacterium]|nr:50S ribosomal protein L23 [Deltaproteobacteria bacterium]MBW2309337.1 50S ribosomal protein L23 [Deltaproteobacteria bacterium]